MPITDICATGSSNLVSIPSKSLFFTTCICSFVLLYVILKCEKYILVFFQCMLQGNIKKKKKDMGGWGKEQHFFCFHYLIKYMKIICVKCNALYHMNDYNKCKFNFIIGNTPIQCSR